MRRDKDFSAASESHHGGPRSARWFERNSHALVDVYGCGYHALKSDPRLSQVIENENFSDFISVYTDGEILQSSTPVLQCRSEFITPTILSENRKPPKPGCSIEGKPGRKSSEGGLLKEKMLRCNAPYKRWYLENPAKEDAGCALYFPLCLRQKPLYFASKMFFRILFARLFRSRNQSNI